METTSALSNGQLASLHIAFRHLGFEGLPERPYRLAAAARALGLDGLDSFKDLSPGQAGVLQGRLHRGEIPVFAGWPDEGWHLAHKPPPPSGSNPQGELDPAVVARIEDAVKAALVLVVLLTWVVSTVRQVRIAIATSARSVR